MQAVLTITVPFFTLILAGYVAAARRRVPREGYWHLQHGGWARDAEPETVPARVLQVAAREERIWGPDVAAA